MSTLTAMPSSVALTGSPSRIRAARVLEARPGAERSGGSYYNEHDPKAAAWLRELITAGQISPGIVDERSITEIKANELDAYTQCHFFAGIGGWSLVLRLAGWPDDAPVWTGSCPCQPLSSGGLGKGHADERHLWPAFFALIAERRPATVFGEQVAGTDGREWFAGIRADLEGVGYACGCADLCAASKALPHPRQRLFWVADADRQRNPRSERPGSGRTGAIPTIWESEKIVQEGQGRVNELVARRVAERIPSYAEAVSVLDGIPDRLALVRGAGNAIVPQVAAEFVSACIEASPSVRWAAGAGRGASQAREHSGANSGNGALTNSGSLLCSHISGGNSVINEPDSPK